jgi:hypothetical protein
MYKVNAMLLNYLAKPSYRPRQVVSAPHSQTEKLGSQVSNRLLHVAKLPYTAHNGLEMIPIEMAQDLHHLLLLSAKA